MHLFEHHYDASPDDVECLCFGGECSSKPNIGWTYASDGSREYACYPNQEGLYVELLQPPRHTCPSGTHPSGLYDSYRYSAEDGQMRYSFAIECLPDEKQQEAPIPYEKSPSWLSSVWDGNEGIVLGIGIGLVGIGVATYLAVRKK